MVTMNAGTRNFVVTTPFSQPVPAPMINVSTIATIQFMPSVFMKTLARIPASAAIDATDRSIPPVIGA